MKVKGYRCKAQSQNTNIKIVNEFTEVKKKIHLNTGEKIFNKHTLCISSE
jgi:hypothetical protein